MSKVFRRFEILLPRRFNDGSEVADDLISETLLELRAKFGAVSCETQTIQGTWSFEAETYRDDLVRVFVDAEDVPESRQFFIDFKERLKQRFDQLDIWLTTYPVEVL